MTDFVVNGKLLTAEKRAFLDGVSKLTQEVMQAMASGQKFYQAFDKALVLPWSTYQQGGSESPLRDLSNTAEVFNLCFDAVQMYAAMTRQDLALDDEIPVAWYEALQAGGAK